MIKKLITLQNKLTPQVDKLGHFYWGFWQALIGVGLYALLDWIYWVLIPATAAGALKEFWDSRGNGNVEFLDFLFTILPAIVFFLLIYSI